MAREGEEWRSPIFDIGTAKPSSNIPAPKQISRKSPHRNTRATINDRPGTATHGQGLDTGSGTGSQSSYGAGTQPSYGASDMSGLRAAEAGAVGGTGGAAGYEAFHSQKGGTGYIPSSGYQPRMSSAADSLKTAVDDHDFEGTHVGKYNVTGSQLQQDPITMPYRGAANTNVASKDPSPQVF
jgi:hypothetical protein